MPRSSGAAATARSGGAGAGGSARRLVLRMGAPLSGWEMSWGAGRKGAFLVCF
jgi:hypothetical protein